jgi:hypothetical protein
MSDFPTNLHEMVRMGYRKTGDGKCKGCGAAIEWWKTTNGHSIPMNPMPMQGTNDSAPAVAHFATCPKAKDFRGKMTADPHGPDAGQVREAMPLERDLREIRRKSNARVVLLIHEDGTCFFYRLGIPGEELRQDIITAANQVRDCIQANPTAGGPR